jgi:simple sugar transport system permease protein
MIDLVLFASALRLATPLLFAAMGGVLCERSGVVNVALEGKLLIGAFASAAVAYQFGNPWWGAAAGMAAGMIFGALLALFAVRFRGDAIVAGIALNLLALGTTQFLLSVLFQTSANSPRIPGFGDITVAGFTPLVPIAVACVIAVVVILRWTRFGLRIIAAGEHPEAVRAAGVDPAGVRTRALLLGGAIAGLGGAYLSLEAAQFVKNMTAGRGFIALAAVIFGKWRPAGAAAACLFFGLAEAIQIRLQGEGAPTQFVQMIPPVLTMIALAGFVGRSRAPADLGSRTE